MLNGLLWFATGGLLGFAISAFLCAAGKADEEAERIRQIERERSQRDVR
jgi:hypothetical protein